MDWPITSVARAVSQPEGTDLLVKANMGFIPYLSNRAAGSRLQENEKQRESVRTGALVRIIREGAESGVWGDEIAPKMIVAA